MTELGNSMIALGFLLMPFSFFFYLPFRWLEYMWSLSYSRVVKAMWYLAYGLWYLNGSLGIETIAMFICFIEGIDLIFQQLEINRERKVKKVR